MTDKKSHPSLLGATLAIVQKDLAAEFRSRELFSAMLVFSLLAGLLSVRRIARIDPFSAAGAR